MKSHMRVRALCEGAVLVAEKGTCMVLRLWNQGGRDKENEEVMRLIEQYVPKPWKERPDGFRLSDHLYLEFDRKFEWPTAGEKSEENLKDESEKESGDESEKNLKNESEENLKEESERESSTAMKTSQVFFFHEYLQHLLISCQLPSRFKRFITISGSSNGY